MNEMAVRNRSLPGVRLTGALVALLAVGGSPAVARAQSAGPPLNTSSEASARLPLALVSPPDDPAVSPRRDATWDQIAAATPVLHNWRIAGSAMKPRENDVSYTINSGGGCTYVTSGDASTVWNAVPDLPDGAVVDMLRMYYDDTSGSNSTAWLTVYDLYGAISEEFSVSSSGSGGNSFNDSATINHTIDYAVHSYLLNWRPVVAGSTMQLCGFRVFYRTPLLLPGAPQNLSAVANGGNVTITWAPPASGGTADSYIIEVGSAPGLTDYGTVAVPATAFAASAVPYGTYYLRVRAVNATGTGPASAEVQLVVP